MQSKLNPYLSFKDNAREAMQFYQSVFGGKLNISTFNDYNMAENPSEGNLVMHSALETDSGFTLMGADTPGGMEMTPNGTIVLSGDNHAELSGYYHKLCEGGQVSMPLEKAPWGDTFGMLVDRYGVNWMVDIGEAER